MTPYYKWRKALFRKGLSLSCKLPLRTVVGLAAVLGMIFSPGLAAADYAAAEKAFESGNFAECSRLTEELLNDSPEGEIPDFQRRKLLAMREYISGSDPAQVAATVKQAKEIASHKAWLPRDGFRHAALLIRRAEDWKARGITEYAELSAAAAKLLSNQRDNGDADLRLQLLVLQTRNANCNGEYNTPLREIQKTLEFYYPARLYQRKKMPEGALVLLILAGKQYAGLGVRATDARAKVDAFSAAARYTLRAWRDLPDKDPRRSVLADRLICYRETLRLLGYSLKLPESLKSERSASVVMADEMLRARRFHDVILGFAAAKEPELQLRRAAAFCAVGDPAKAVAIVNAPQFVVAEPHFLLDMARNALSGNAKPEAAVFLKLYLQLVPDGSDSYNAACDYSALLIGLGRYRQASEVLTSLATQTTDVRARQKFLFTQAQCLYRIEQYTECAELLRQLPESTENMRLSAQALIRGKDHAAALAVLKKLAEQAPNMLEWRNVMRMLIPCALAVDKPYAEKILFEFLEKLPKEDESFDYARHLLALLEERNADSPLFSRLGNWALKHHLENAAAMPLVLRCAKNCPDGRLKKELFLGLLRRKEFSDAELTALLEHLPDRAMQLAFLNRFAAPLNETPASCELHWRIAKMESTEGRHAAALARCNALLAQKEVYRYREVKQMQAQTSTALHQEPEARAAWRELLEVEKDAKEKRRIVLEIARSHERSGEWKPALAMAWTAVPPEGGAVEPEVKSLLELIVRCADKAASPQDADDARELLNENQ